MKRVILSPFRSWLAKKLARTMLFIKATTYRNPSEKPYIWACGMPMWIYNDNRMMLSNFKHRMRIALGFKHIIQEKNINPDYIIGTMTAGIAPAASVAQIMNKKLLINYNGNYLIYKEQLWKKNVLRVMKNEMSDFNIVLATSPFAIPHGVQYANKLKVGFAYIRSEKKEHGKEQKIEGIVKPGMKFFLVHDMRLANNKEVFALTKKIEDEFKVKCVGSYGIVNDFEKNNFFDLVVNKKAVVIEDLFSTGGSSALEVYKAREMGMIVNDCLSIFSYGFDCLKKQFSGEINISKQEVKLSEPCEIDSLLPFWILMEEIRKLQFYSHSKAGSMEAEIAGFDERYKKFLTMPKNIEGLKEKIEMNTK